MLPLVFNYNIRNCTGEITIKSRPTTIRDLPIPSHPQSVFEDRLTPASPPSFTITEHGTTKIFVAWCVPFPASFPSLSLCLSVGLRRPWGLIVSGSFVLGSCLQAVLFAVSPYHKDLPGWSVGRRQGARNDAANETLRRRGHAISPRLVALSLSTARSANHRPLHRICNLYR